MSRPSIAPETLASITDAAPSRLICKLDKRPRFAEDWSWSESADGTFLVVTDSGETVTLRPRGGTIATADQVSCTCLLAPRCLHILATLTALPIFEGTGEHSLGAQGDSSDLSDSPDIGIALGVDEVSASSLLFQIGSTLLDAGALSAGAVMQAELLRAVHGCRTRGLHRASAAGLRLLRCIRDLREERPEFALSDLASDFLQVLEISRVISSAGDRPVDPSWIGTARRTYRAAGGGGGKRLSGLFSEPIVAGSGYAGVVTYLCDREGQVFSVSDVVPAEPSRAVSSYDAAIRLGEATISHRALSRRGLFIHDATVSTDGRLGAGSDVKAVASGPSSWLDDGPRKLWETPLPEQLERVRDSLALPVTERTAASDLLFLRGKVLGLVRNGAVCEIGSSDDGEPLLVVARIPREHEVLAYRDNFRQLGRAPGLKLLVIGRALLSRPRTIEILAAGPAPLGDEVDTPRLHLAEDWGDRINLGFDRLQGANMGGGLRAGNDYLLEVDRPPDPLEPLRRRIERLALGGRGTLPASALREVDLEASRLDRSMMPTASSVLRGLGEAASHAARSLKGTRVAGDPEVLAQAWLSAALYERAATLELQFKSWL